MRASDDESTEDEDIVSSFEDNYDAALKQLEQMNLEQTQKNITERMARNSKASKLGAPQPSYSSYSDLWNKDASKASKDASKASKGATAAPKVPKDSTSPTEATAASERGASVTCSTSFS